MNPVRVSLVFAAACTLVACGTPAADQTIGGKAALSTFPSAPTEVQAVQGTQVAARAPVASDGAFSLQLSPGAGYRLEFVNADGQTVLVFPRSSGSIDSRFDIRASDKAFDLGQVRFVGDPSAQTFSFTTPGSTTAALASTGDDVDDVQCENGIDAVTGAVCVDDNDEESAGSCEGAPGADDAGGTEGAGGAEADGDNTNCEDGIDPATGAECDGGPAANADDGTEAGAPEDETVVPSSAAVAEHNLPAAMGCSAEADSDNVECDNGIDPTTGLECDGGPAANAEGKE